MTGFEPAAPSSRTKCATKLRYIPFEEVYGMAPPPWAHRQASSPWSLTDVA
jgi:hypothetical protein